MRDTFLPAIIVVVLLSGVVAFYHQRRPPKKPNIFVIMVDDMGVNDVSFRGSDQFFTPNIDALAYNGVILKNYYVSAMCTPSRAALMTGKYPTTTGMQHFVIDSDEPWGLPLEEKILPEYFRAAGYSTSLFGKWHLGFHRRAYLPNSRGFDHFFGYRGPYVDYWNHELHKLDRNYSSGFDMWENERPSYETGNTYATTLLTDKAIEYVENYDTRSGKPMFMYFSHLAPHTANENDPLQAPKLMLDRFGYIKNPRRRVFAAMMATLDEEIGRFITTLSRKGILENSVILFFSDNGAPTYGLHSNSGSNYPFKGQKNSPWEGALRSPGIVWSPLIKSSGRVSDQLIHITDWLPTLAKLAGIRIPNQYALDGLDVWDAVSKHDGHSPREDILHNADPIYDYTSYMWHHFKYVQGTVDPYYDDWFGEIPGNENPESHLYSGQVLSSSAWKAVAQYRKRPLKVSDISRLRREARVTCPITQTDIPNDPCHPDETPCLFNVHDDPCERFNLANHFPVLLSLVEDRLDVAKERAIYPRNQPLDPRSDPGLNYGVWTYWLDYLGRQEVSK